LLLIAGGITGYSGSNFQQTRIAPLLSACPRAMILFKIAASTLIAYGDRDFLYPVEMAVENVSRHSPVRSLGGTQRRPWAGLL
jgi:hypothetical protein